MILSNSTSPILEIGSGDRQIDYRKIHSPARPNGDDGRVAIRKCRHRNRCVALMLEHRSRDLRASTRRVIDKPDNEFVFNGNADFPRLSLL
jgi:hypothetical protein